MTMVNVAGIRVLVCQVAVLVAVNVTVNVGNFVSVALVVAVNTTLLGFVLLYNIPIVACDNGAFPHAINVPSSRRAILDWSPAAIATTRDCARYGTSA